MSLIKLSLYALVFLCLINILGCSAEGSFRGTKEITQNVKDIFNKAFLKGKSIFKLIITFPALKIILVEKILGNLFKFIQFILKKAVETVTYVNTFKISMIAEIFHKLKLDSLIKGADKFIMNVYNTNNELIKRILDKCSDYIGPYKKALLPITNIIASRILIILNGFEAFLTGNIEFCTGNSYFGISPTKALVETKTDKMKRTIKRILILFGFGPYLNQDKNIQPILKNRIGEPLKRKIRSVSSRFFERNLENIGIVDKGLDLERTFVVNDKIVSLGKFNKQLVKGKVPFKP